MNKELWVSCPFCSLHCADLHLIFDEGRLTQLSPKCELGERKFNQAFENITKCNKKSNLTDEFTRAFSILKSARRLLVVLSADAPNETVESSLRMIRKFNGVLTLEDDGLDCLNLSMKEVGSLTATLGEIKEVETVFICGTNPESALPRLTEFLSKDVIEKSIFLNPCDSFTTIRWLRLAMADEKLEIPVKYEKIIDAIHSASMGVVLVDSAFLHIGEPMAREFLLWLRDLNRFGRWFAQYLPCGANSVGVVESLLSSAGVISGLKVGEDIEEISPRHWRTEKLIEEGWMDVCLFVGNPRTLDEKVTTCLHKVKTILVDPMPPSWEPEVWLPVAQAGVDAAGSMARLDGVPIFLEQLVNSGRLPIRTVLDMLVEGRVPS